MYFLISKSKKNKICKTVLCLVAIFASMNVGAITYKCETGEKITFQSRPCRDGHQTIIEKPQQAEQTVNHVGDEDGLIIGKFVLKFDHDLSHGKSFVYKVRVTNTSNRVIDLSLVYHAVDRQEFFVKSARAWGVIPANSDAVLTNQINLTHREYARMYKWLLTRQIKRNQIDRLEQPILRSSGPTQLN